MKGLSEEVSNYFFCWAEVDAQVLLLELIMNEKVASIQVLHLLRRRLSPVLLQQNGALIVLVENGVYGLVTLRLEEHVCPQNNGHKIIRRDKFCLR